MADGTPLEALETGADIPNAADAQKMAEIMREMNARDDVVAAPPPQMHPSIPYNRPSAPSRPLPPANYVEMEEESPRPRKKNLWGTLASKLRDPLFVSLLVFVLSLPILHTHLAKYAGWAFAVGGQLSWIGLLALSLIAGVLFGGFQGVASLIA
jgi:hypothetical protein